MIIRFPDLNTLQLALTSGTVPPDVAQKSAIAGFGEENQLWVETSTKLTTAAQRELKRLGALVCKSSGAALSTEVSCWLELLPLFSDDAALDALEQTPVLFDVPSGEALSHLVLEMLRLGNDRQSYRWLEETGKRADGGRALLRVVGPPYYSLLRALDQLGGPDVAPNAFLERAPGVWVQAGFRHPLAANIKPPKGQILLLRPPRQWLLLPDAPFHDVYEIVAFQLPGAVTPWKDSPLPRRLTVAPRLRQAGPSDGAELWVLRGDAIDELNRFVQNAEDQLLHRLAFAVGEKNGQRIVVLRVRQSKLPPPVLILPAEAYKSYLKLTNLFLPAGCLLHPPLRRDVVRKLLAEDVSQITWLVQEGNRGSFTPEGLPDDVFRPLTDWVDYVLDRDREKLQAWVQAMQFDFESFVCDEEQPAKPKKPPSAEKTRGSKGGSARQTKEGEAGATTTAETPAESSATDDAALEAFAAVEKMEPSVLEKELRAVEEEFLSQAGGLDDEGRQALWPRLADLNARLLRTEDAGICWLNALWEGSEAANAAAGKWTAAWFRSEALGAMHRQTGDGRGEQTWLLGMAATDGVRREVAGADLDRLLQRTEPTTTDLRALAAYLAWSARREPRPAPLVERLATVQRFLEKHERLLPVRACWLAWYSLVQLLDGDVLALARARDRLLERLFHNGLRPEQDLPGFLRFAGQPASMRFRGVGQWLDKLCDKAVSWLSKQKVASTAIGKTPATAAYVELVFAFGLARLGETDASRQRLKHARLALQSTKKLAHEFLAQAFALRIEQAQNGQPPVGTLFSPEELQRLDDEEAKRRAPRANQNTSAELGPRYVIDRMRNLSRILEPHQRVEAYRSNFQYHEDHEKRLAELPDLLDKKELADRVYQLLHQAPKGVNRPEVRIKILQVALDQAPRVQEEFACDMLERAVQAYDAGLSAELNADALRNLATLLQKALFVAGHFDRVEHVHAFVARFQALLQSQFRKMLETAADSLTIETVDSLAGHCLYGLRKLGLRGEIERLLGQMTDSILGGRSLETVAADRNNWSLVRALLPVAGGRYYFGQDDQAESVFQAARVMLFKNDLNEKQQTPLACTYASALGQAPMQIAQQRLTEIFERLEQIFDGYSTMEYFSRFQFQLVESAVLAVVSDDFTQGTQARRWLDEDEYLVRQRIHADVRNLLAQA